MSRVRRALLVAGVALAATLPWMVASPASAATGSITVTVLAEDTGSAPASACLSVWRSPSVATPEGPFVGQVCTSQGEPLVYSGLTVGTDYYLEVGQVPGYAQTWAGGVDWYSATAYTPPAEVSVVVQRLVPVSGTLLDNVGAPAAGADISFEEAGGGARRAATTTDAAGHWSLLVEPGDYYVRYVFEGNTFHARGKTSAESADLIVVAANTPVTLDDTLPAAIAVQATVTAADTGAPVAGACGVLVSTTNPFLEVGGGCADANGVLDLTDVTPGSWQLQVTDPTFTYAAARSAPFTLTAGQQVSGLTVSMPRAGLLTGRVVDWVSGKPLSGICVYAFEGTSGPVVPGLSRNCSDADGRWTTAGVRPGAVTAWAEGDDTHLAAYAPGVRDQSAGKLFTVASGATTSVGTIRLHQGAVLTGRITDRRGRPVVGAVVGTGLDAGLPSSWLPYAGTDWRSLQYAAVTDAQGRYRIQRIEPMRQAVIVQAEGQPYAWQWSGEASDPAQAKAFSFGYDSTVRFNAELAPEAVVTVNVSGAGTRSGTTAAYTRSGALVGWPAVFTGDGPAVIRGLPAGSVKVAANAGDGATVWFSGATSLANARLVTTSPTRPATIAIRVP